MSLQLSLLVGLILKSCVALHHYLYGTSKGKVHISLEMVSNGSLGSTLTELQCKIKGHTGRHITSGVRVSVTPAKVIQVKDRTGYTQLTIGHNGKWEVCVCWAWSQTW